MSSWVPGAGRVGGLLAAPDSVSFMDQVRGRTARRTRLVERQSRWGHVPVTLRT
ncbi:MAG: hypothetical protein AVDCRST_MAG77-3646 [uncultured Chloroflexi bacterium]|uniref:Uncharacterized protein n=1 Tax=uncultured Chloroflexota bacterium TaxID=166587 RepID=A0A6J4JIH0_9CHLR|nr:MAG: hypothetical protein AVDCRST_MAG77-3646 [uncultured Chloroflexota bacterium]